jgi:dolichol kinase
MIGFNKNVNTNRAISIRYSELVNALPARSDLHIARKIWHILTGLLLVGTFVTQAASQAQIVTFLSVLLVAVSSLEFFRLKNPALNEKVIRLSGPIIRTNEVAKVSGVPFYVASSLIAIALFPKNVAVLSLLYLVLGDPIASFVGILSKKNSIQLIPGKSFQGTAAGFAVCALSTWFYLRSVGMHGIDLIRLTLLGGLAGALAEVLPFDIDDNFTIPMVSGFVLWLGFILIHFV